MMLFPPDFLIIALMALGIAWNLVLAAIPCFLAYEIPVFLRGRPWSGLSKSDRFIFIIAVLLWFFFFPNTAYMFTLVRHLVAQCTDYNIHNVCYEEAWQTPALFLYALVGLPAFVYSLKQMTNALGRWLPFFVLPLASFGILLGLWERANTWDIVARPFLLIQKTADYFVQPIELLNWMIYTAILFIIYYGTLYLWNRRPQ